MSGLSSTGFDPKRLPEIKADLEEQLTAALGPIVLTPGSVTGQLVGIFSQELAGLWELMEGIYFSQYPNTAEGINLDNSAQLVGVTRLPASKSTILAIARADINDVIDAGSLAQLQFSDEQFEVLSSVTVTADNLHQTLLYLATGTSPSYTVTVNGNAYVSALTLPNAGTDLQSKIQTGETGISVAVGLGDNNDVYLTINANDPETPAFSIAVSSNIVIQEYWAPVSMQAMNTGPVPVLAHTLNQIVTASTNWDEIDNLFAGVEGEDAESDAAFRIRRAQSLGLPGKGTVPAIEAALLEVEGVTKAYARSNNAGGVVLCRTNGGTYTAGNIGAYVNGVATAIVPYNTDRDTTLNDLATAIEALTAVSSCIYDSSLDLITINMSTNDEPTYSIVAGGVVGTLIFDVGDTITMPGHSLNILVAGGADADIAESIWNTKPAGVQLIGSDSETVYDSAQMPHTIKYDRPTPQYAWADITLTLHPEEDFPADGLDQVKAAVVAYGEGLTNGDDYILQRLYGPIYSVDGIASAVIQIAITTTPCGSPSYGSSNIPIYENEYLVFDEVRVQVA